MEANMPDSAVSMHVFNPAEHYTPFNIIDYIFSGSESANQWNHKTSS